MFNSKNISANFNVNTLANSRAFGYGSIDFSGVSVNYTVYPSNYGLGIMVALPSRPKMKQGVQEKDTNGRPVYVHEVFIKDPSIRTLVDEAVLDAMANKGVYTEKTAIEAQKAGVSVTNVVPNSDSNSFSNPNTTAPVKSSPTVKADDELPF